MADSRSPDAPSSGATEPDPVTESQDETTKSNDGAGADSATAPGDPGANGSTPVPDEPVKDGPPVPDEPTTVLPEKPARPLPEEPTEMVAAGATAVMADGSRTVALPPATSPGQPTVRLAAAPTAPVRLPSGADTARWSGRSGPGSGGTGQFRATNTAGLRTSVPAEAPGYAPGVEHRRGAFPLAPILLTLLTLAFIGALGVGIWMIVGALRTHAPLPVPSPSAAPAVPQPSDLAASESSPEPSPTSPPPTSDSPADVRVPPLIGSTEAAARAILAERGLQAVSRTSEDGSHPAGTILSTDPAEGALLPVGSIVTLVVARAPASPSPSPSPSPSASPSRSHSPAPSSPPALIH